MHTACLPPVRWYALAAILCMPPAAARAGEARSGAAEAVSLTAHVRTAADLGDLRDVTAAWAAGVLRLASDHAERYAWAVIPPPPGGWDLARRATVDAEIVNTGTTAVGVMLWVVGDHGWDAVPAVATLAPAATHVLACNLRETFPDGTPKIDPAAVKQLQVMLFEPRVRPDPPEVPERDRTVLSSEIRKPVAIAIRSLVARGEAAPWRRPAGRIDVPLVEEGPPAPGRRVRYRLPGDEGTDIHGVLHLPTDWRPDGKYPVVVELPGNIFFTSGCYSTGRPEQCVIGFGMTRGRGAICLGLPFVDRATGRIAEHGWGDPDATADEVVRMVDDVCERFGGDRGNLVLTGFSRGALACGYIGLRNDRIAALWKGFHACQHYDGDGWGGATMPEAIERAGRFRGTAVFQTDNSQEAFEPVMEAMRARVTWARSGLNAHATAMFLDDRPSTRELREWFAELVGAP